MLRNNSRHYKVHLQHNFAHNAPDTPFVPMCPDCLHTMYPLPNVQGLAVVKNLGGCTHPHHAKHRYGNRHPRRLSMEIHYYYSKYAFRLSSFPMRTFSLKRRNTCRHSEHIWQKAMPKLPSVIRFFLFIYIHFNLNMHKISTFN